MSACLLILQTPQIIASSNSSNATTLITNACHRSPNKNQCIQFLNSAPPNQKTNLKGLAFFALKLGEKSAAQTAFQIKRALNNSDLLPVLQQALSDCSQHYTSLIELIEASVEAAVSDSFLDVKFFVNAAVADVEACRGSLGTLAEGGIENSGLVKFEKRAKELNVDVLLGIGGKGMRASINSGTMLCHTLQSPNETVNILQ